MKFKIVENKCSITGTKRYYIYYKKWYSKWMPITNKFGEELKFVSPEIARNILSYLQNL